MIPLDPLPQVFSRYAALGGVLEFAIHDQVSGAPAELAAALAALFGRHGDPVDRDRLAALTPRPLTAEAFLGDWIDGRGRLLRRGDYVLADGRKVRDPRLDDLGGAPIVSGGGPLPPMGDGGQFAYAFAHPPYGVRGDPAQVQAVFDKVRAILPPHEPVEILDWSSTDLPQVSPYFDAGAEWWGVFLFSLYQPISRRLIVVAGSATD